MLLWFRFKNFGPFREEALLDMRAVKAYKELPDHVIKVGNQDVARTAAIYGANASGKSNLVKAVEYFRNMILFSMSNVLDEEAAVGMDSRPAMKTYYNPFRFNQNSSHEPTEFEACVYALNKEYQYGFAYDESAIRYEWLYVTTNGGRQETIFERDIENGIEFGDNINQEECRKYLSGLRDQVLLLTFFNQIKLSDYVWEHAKTAMRSLFVWDVSYVNKSLGFVSAYLDKECEDGDKKDRLIKYLSHIDMSIVDFEIYRQENQDPKVYTIHLDSDRNRYLMPLEQESSGTIKALTLYLMIGNEMRYDCVFFLDELNAHLHPLLTKYFVNRYYEDGVKEQLIFTTHDIYLLDRRYMRRDQVWFVEKKGNESSLFSLADFKVRNDASLQKNYLSGNYGAIPILGENIE